MQSETQRSRPDRTRLPLRRGIRQPWSVHSCYFDTIRVACKARTSHLLRHVQAFGLLQEGHAAKPRLNDDQKHAQHPDGDRQKAEPKLALNPLQSALIRVARPEALFALELRLPLVGCPIKEHGQGRLFAPEAVCVFYYGLWRGRLSRRRTMRALLLERAGRCLSPPFKGPTSQGPGLSGTW